MDSTMFRILFLAVCAQVCIAEVVINVSANSEGDIILTCSVNGDYRESITWSTNRTGSSVAISGGDDFSQFEVLSNNTLIIREVTAQYHGYYFCNHATSGQGIAKIRKAPFLQIARHPLGNGDLLLTCLVNELTVIPVTWLYKATRNMTAMVLQGGGGDDDHIQVLMNNTLIVRDFGSQDVGHYTCQATDDGLTRNATANVSLAARPTTITFTTYQDEDNFDFFITCNVNGRPAMPNHDIIWSYSESRDDPTTEMILPGNEDSDLQILSNLTLLIREYDPDDDSGRYYCNARLPDGTRRSVPIDVGGGPLTTAANVWLITIVTIVTLLKNAS